MEVSPETLSRWENDKAPMSPSIEKLLRVFVGVRLSQKAPAIEFDSADVIKMNLRAVRPEYDVIVGLELVKFKSVQDKPAEWNFEKQKKSASG